MASYVAFALGLAFVYALLAVGQNVLTGYGGLFGLHMAATFGMGAYIWAWVAPADPVLVLVCYSLALVVAGSFSGIVGVGAAKTRGDWEAIYTFCIQMVVFSVFWNWEGVFAGPLGISAPRIDAVLRGWMGVVIWPAVTLLLIVVAGRIESRPWILKLIALREDEQLAVSLGARPQQLRIGAYVVAGCLGGAAGAVYGGLIGYVDPTPFEFMTSVLLIAGIVLGGLGSHLGAALGGALVFLLPETLAWVGIPVHHADDIRNMIFGLLLVGVVLWRPQGILGRFKLQ